MFHPHSQILLNTLKEGNEEKQHAIYSADNARSGPGSYIWAYTQWWSKMHKQRKLRVPDKHATLTYLQMCAHWLMFRSRAWHFFHWAVNMLSSINLSKHFTTTKKKCTMLKANFTQNQESHIYEKYLHQNIKSDSRHWCLGSYSS